MRVTVTIQLDVDPEAWALQYGVTGARALREDVKLHATAQVVGHFRSLDLLVDDSAEV